jgi:hypothetical protein
MAYRKDLERSAALMMKKIKNPIINLSSADFQAVKAANTNKIKSGMTNIINDGIKEHIMLDSSDFKGVTKKTAQKNADEYNKYISGPNAPYNREKKIPGYTP